MKCLRPTISAPNSKISFVEWFTTLNINKLFNRLRRVSIVKENLIHYILIILIIFMLQTASAHWCVHDNCYISYIKIWLLFVHLTPCLFIIFTCNTEHCIWLIHSHLHTFTLTRTWIITCCWRFSERLWMSQLFPLLSIQPDVISLDRTRAPFSIQLRVTITDEPNHCTSAQQPNNRWWSTRSWLSASAGVSPSKQHANN